MNGELKDFVLRKQDEHTKTWHYLKHLKEYGILEKRIHHRWHRRSG